MRFFNPFMVWGNVPIAAKMSRTVKSVQQGSIALAVVSSNTATITSVDTTRSICLYLGSSTDATSSAAESDVRVTLTNATTVTANRGSATNNTTVNYTVVEFY